jgi:hypothetical protein
MESRTPSAEESGSSTTIQPVLAERTAGGEHREAHLDGAPVG